MEKIERVINKDLILREKMALQRTVMANQTTFLSFLRTALYFLVAGLSVRQFLDLNNGLLVEIVLFFFAVLIFSIGLYNFLRNRKLINESEKHIGNFILEYLKDK